MVRDFARLHRRLLAENRLIRYLAYATGEIVLVAIGIPDRAADQRLE